MLIFDERRYVPCLKKLKARQATELHLLTEAHERELEELPGRRAKNLVATLKYREDVREQQKERREEEQRRQKDFSDNPEKHVCEDCGKQSVDVQPCSGNWGTFEGTYCPDCYAQLCEDE